MKKIIFYLLLFATLLIAALVFLYTKKPAIYVAFEVPTICGIVGGLGGILYCIRAIYLNVAVRKQWDESWTVWYYLRPIASIGSGMASYIFLEAGLLVLESNPSGDASNFGFYALAFIAGLNVDKFIKKIESLAETVWGIEQSRSQKISDEERE